MAKKKQFAGKETKLAKLPLTQALVSQTGGRSAGSPAPTPTIAIFPQVPLTWDEVSAGGGGPLAAAFLFVVQELAALQWELQSGRGSGGKNLQSFLPDRVPRQSRLIPALRQARQTLRELQSLLSPF